MKNYIYQIFIKFNPSLIHKNYQQKALFINIFKTFPHIHNYNYNKFLYINN